MCKTLRCSLMLFGLLLSTNPGWAQGSREYATAEYLSENNQNGSISGTVKTSNGQPVEAATVLIDGLNKGAFTNEQGIFSLKNVKPGTHKLRVTYLGQEVLEQTVTVQPQEATAVTFVFNKTSQQLAEVVITEKKTLNQKTVTVSKMAIRPIDLPQSVTVIDKEVLEQQQTLHLSEALQNVNGVYLMGVTGGTQEELAARGYAMSSSNTFKNGARYNNSIMPEMSSLERVEVLKGSNAILYGNLAAGGAINLVTKKPTFENGGEITMRLGSYGFYKPSLDLHGAINNSDKVAYRLNTSYETAGSFRNQVSSERFYINPSFLIKASKKTDILVEGDFLRDRRTPDFGTGAINYTVANVPRNRYLGVSWGYFEADQKGITTTITHQFNPNWQLQAIGNLQGYSNDQYTTNRPNGNSQMIQPDGTWNRTLQRTQVDEKYLLGQLDLTGKFITGPLQHTVLVGADVDRYRTNNTGFTINYNPVVYDPKDPKKVIYDIINIYNPEQYREQNYIPQTTPATFTKNPVNRMGLYAQDLISLTKKIKVLAGIRYTYQASNSIAYTVASNGSIVPPVNKATGSFITPAKRYDEAFTPRLGVVYQPIKSTAVFASYANSFTLNTGLDIYNERLAPSFIDQYEVGVKNDLFKGLLSANLTAYQIINSNLAQAVTVQDIPADALNKTNPQELGGKTASKGLELDLMTKSFRGFSFIGGYSYNEMRYVKSTTNVVGSRLRYNPSHTANASVYYTFINKLLPGLNLGLTTFYVGDRLAGRSTRTNVANDTYRLMPLPNFFQFDTHVGYTLQKVTFRFKVTNLLNKLSYYAHDDNSINPIAPRQFSTTLSYQF